ncbi:MerR family transcriptional regulator [Cetobacterium sp. 8H]|uniref:MerR family transcriptional regulator n=1 Tax=Cetobacterium sp. 8H TaxID=2759681 RepID=UPI00163C11DF|nr:MerR family transcriptional regulator [Cetobacterium sp. 8H]MBC2851559.1 MerR family transcriptional regulator [Cetobacterium sp. 8H]
MKLYKISEIAKTFGITRETLIYYDSIDLFKPHTIDKESGYRYYSDKSISDLYFITMLKKNNFSLKEIKEYINCKNTNESIELLSNKLKQIKQNIEVLKQSASIISDKINEIERFSDSEECMPFFEYFKITPTLLMSIDEPKSEKELFEGIKKLNKIRKSKGLEKVKRITILNSVDIIDGNYFRIDKIGVAFDELENSNMKADFVASIYHKNSTNKIGDSYDKLKKFIHDKNYTISGNSIEIFNDIMVNAGNCRGRTIKICIPITKKDPF